MPAAGGILAGESAFTPLITAFCCRRSAARAAELSTYLGISLPRGLQLVEVPCGGSVSMSQILAAFNGSADGVVMFTCHEGNCHSTRGAWLVQQRVDQISAIFESIGLQSGRLVKKSLASNMGVEFAKDLADFEKQLLQMGPLKLKSGTE
jgi:coenzyme F420-reducing hydrogenase delta subunit